STHTQRRASCFAGRARSWRRGVRVSRDVQGVPRASVDARLHFAEGIHVLGGELLEYGGRLFEFAGVDGNDGVLNAEFGEPCEAFGGAVDVFGADHAGAFDGEA